MLHLHRTLVAAPLFFSLACTVSVNGSASDVTAGETTTSTSEPATTNPSTDPTTNPTTTPDTSTSGTTGDPDPTTGATTTTTASATTSSGSTGGDTDPGAACMASADCADGEACFAPYAGETPVPEDFTCHAECVSDMGDGNSEDVWCGDTGSCCTDGSECNDMGYCVAGGGSTGPDTDTGSTGDTDSTAGSSGTGGTTGDTDTGGGVLPLIILSGLEVFGDCMPMIPEDPISAKWIATFDNKLGMADYTATVTSATLTYSPGNMEFVQDITVAPLNSGIVGAGKTVMKAQSKTKALMNLPMDCSQCGKPVDLDIVFTVDGQDVPVTTSTVMTCGL